MNTVYVLVAINVALIILAVISLVNLCKCKKIVSDTLDKYVDLQNAIHIAEDDKPQKDTASAFAMKLSNEIEKYIFVDDEKNKIKLLVVDPKATTLLK